MLPDIATCQRKIKAWRQRSPSGSTFFEPFWDWKTQVENEGSSILDQGHVAETARRLREFLIGWDMKRTGVAFVPELERILKGIRPSYARISRLRLGQGLIPLYTKDIEEIYRGLGGITNNRNRRFATRQDSSLTGKSKALLAIWGQTPGFDSIVTSRFIDWAHGPKSAYLPYLCHGKYNYSAHEYTEILVELDSWVTSWSAWNHGVEFTSLMSGFPPGWIIDRLYYWGPRKPRV